jgi:hypothetical protein
MDAFVIQGGRKLSGRVEVSGAKNAALPVMAATLLAPGVHTLRNVPLLSDTRTMARVLERLGARVEFRGRACKIDTSTVAEDSNETTIDVLAKRFGSKLRPVVHLYDSAKHQLAWSLPQTALADQQDRLLLHGLHADELLQLIDVLADANETFVLTERNHVRLPDQ